MPTIAAFGGAYANPHALAAMLADARDRGCERIFSPGDLGGFGAECNAPAMATGRPVRSSP